MESYLMVEERVLGECPGMCPKQEIILRERHRLLHPFEILQGTERQKIPKADHEKIVKEYSRSAAGKDELQSQKLRPPHVLLKTVNFLIDRVAIKTNCPWSRVYEYIFDRLRAVRQDMVVQRITGKEAIMILEKIIYFHIYSEYRLCGSPMVDFDPQINETHTRECLKRLLVMYETESRFQENKPIFLALYILYNLGNTEALKYVIEEKAQIRCHPWVKIALEINYAWYGGNYVRIFRLSKKLDIIPLFALHRHTRTIHRHSLQVMTSAFSSKNTKFPLDKLAILLNLDDCEEAANLCKHYGLTVNGPHVGFLKGTFQEIKEPHGKNFLWIDMKTKELDPDDLIHGRS